MTRQSTAVAERRIPYRHQLVRKGQCPGYTTTPVERTVTNVRHWVRYRQGAIKTEAVVEGIFADVSQCAW